MSLPGVNGSPRQPDGKQMTANAYDPLLSEACFMDLVGAIEKLLKTDASLKSLERVPSQQRNAAMRLGDAAAHYRSIHEPR